MAMTVSQAAKVFEETKKEMARLKPQNEAARDVLLEYFEKNPNKRDYNGRIGFSESTREVLDTASVKAFLGKRLPKFLKPQTVRQLSLLKK